MQENHKTELILFDLDGTLIDTAPDFHTSLNTMLRKYNMNEVSESDIRPHISEGTSKLIKKFFAIDEDDSKFETLKSEFLSEYNMNKTDGCQLFNGMTSLINFMDKNNIKYGVVTNKFFKFASPIIESFLELKNIKVIVCPDHVKISKPDPEGILLACKKLDINPLNTIYLGDHINDLKAGLSAGVRILGCLYGYSLDEKNLNKLNYPYIKNISEIYSHINT
ncbi:HAD-IA family hydrolase [Gammaproteobacteria bacterium]|nr:HAD-IA family hydrolase [Gammaproteobacteria bacterium]